MRREGRLEDFSDGKLYKSTDMVRANCLDCKGCSSCCHDMGNTIQLDPLDVHRLSLHFQKSWEELLAMGVIELQMVDGLILPNMAMREKDNACYCLNEQGRCSIHESRPGICRLFPLGRYYENGSFSYFLQSQECPFPNKTKIKVSKWVDTEMLRQYEEFVTHWHYFIKEIGEMLQQATQEERKKVTMAILQYFYGNTYGNQEFYQEYDRREKQFRSAFAM